MERLHRPERFDSDPSSSAAPQEWRHWFMTFENFLGALPQENQNKLKNKTLDLATAVDQARALDWAQKNSDLYSATQPSRVLSAATQDTVREVYVESPPIVAVVKGKCFFCGNSRHPRARCPARESICHKCQKEGHFAKVCRATSTTTTASAATTVSDDRVTLASVTSAATPGVLSKAVAKITINGTEVEGLIDSGSSDSFIHPDIVKRYALSVHHSQCAVSMATSTLSAQTSGYCQVNLNVNGMDYHEMRLAILP
ncbi:hypothetical protein Pcinc_005167 [Petrolisthes cinctipes]|uniref:CCHC-type domain-containing protein n=1 Tax=Petrolisthes cinctipes TaxID=88211 RepID=A0AAE1GE60_PETCI|nr:hypothetical protein Pcinc_005167 [Petrolisthes cinctipes]